MRILLLDQFSELGGAQRMLLDLLPALHERGWQAALGLPGDGPLCRCAREFGCEVLTIDCGPYALGRKSLPDFWRFVTDSPRLARQIGRLAKEFEPETIYINGPRLLPAAARAELRQPVVFHAHISITQPLVRFLAGHSLARLNARTIAVSETVAAGWRPYTQATVIYNGVAGRRPRARSPLQKTPLIGCIGRISPEKGQVEFLKAAAKINKALPGARFLICGAPLFSDPAALAYERRVREHAAGLPVTFTGWVSDVHPILQELDLLLVPSVWPEPNPRVVLEAFAAGLPVIALNVGGLPEIIDHGRTGFLCHTPAEMADLAVELMADGAFLNRVAEAARESWQANFTLERWQQQVLAEIERTAGRAPATHAAAQRP